MTSTHQNEFIQFLLDAKRQTYAAQGDNATVTPFLLGSHQLEYQAGRYLYRDIYFGEAYFGGQETVYDHNQLLWTMCYTGGVVSSITSTDHIVKIYAFLRAALLLIVGDRPYRGPQLYNDGSYAYKNESWGMVDCFHGHETITDTDMLVYDLHYSGGFLR